MTKKRNSADVPGDLGTIVSFYTAADERARLASGTGPFEFARTQEILKRYLPPPPAVVIDAGGAAGPYSLWLAAEGYEAHLVDPVPSHVEQARQASLRQPEAPVRSLTVGDARRLEFPGRFADAVLMAGPLYHLTHAEHRAKALSEAFRVLRPGGCLFAAGISRFASAIEGLVNGYIGDDAFLPILLADLREGQHRNPTGNPAFFTDAYFHRPDELREEVEAAGFAPEALIMIDPFAYHLKDFERLWSDRGRRETLLDVARRIESEPSLMGVGPHFMAVGRKPTA
jgi:ubiquinone/menaquinone biosynthesis C-methylase UbiE